MDTRAFIVQYADDVQIAVRGKMNQITDLMSTMEDYLARSWLLGSARTA